MKKTTNISSVVFMVLGALFLVYGVYMIITSIKYVTTYTTTATISIGGSMQYVVSSSISYFGFGLLFIGVSIIIKKLNAVINNAIATTPAAPAPMAAPVVAPLPADPEVSETPAKTEAPAIAPEDDEEEPGFEVEYIYAEEPVPVEVPAPVEEPAPAEVPVEEPVEEPEQPKIIRDPLAIPSDGLPEIAPEETPVEPEATPMTLEEPPVVAEDTEPEFEVEYIYADEPAPAPVSETVEGLNRVLTELEEIKIEEELAGISEEIAEDVKSEDASFKITSDFIKNIFESK